MTLSRREVLAAAAVAGVSSVRGVSGLELPPCRYVDDGRVPTSGLLDAIEDWRSEEIETDTHLAVIDGWRHGVDDCVELEPEYRVRIDAVVEIA